MSYYRRGVDWSIVAVGALVLATGILGIIGIWKYVEHRAKCTDNGGHWEKYNCHTETYSDCHYNMNGELTICLPATRRVCDERCVGANAESASP
jgi:hypothetical protein